MENIKQIIDEFISMNVRNTILPFLIVGILMFFGIIVNYILIYKTRLMTKVLQSHGFIKEDEDELNEPHFHNMDSLDGSYDIIRQLPKKWDGKHFLFIPTGKINTIEKKRRNLTIWYNGYSSKGIVYRAKKIHKNWRQKVVSKEKITNYNGTFIMSNMFVKTLNLTSLEIDMRDKKEFELIYLFDNGSNRSLMISPEDFFKDILYKDIPYNIAFLSQCEIVELY